MKGFFVFYASIILVVFCLMNSSFDTSSSLIYLNKSDTYSVTISGAVEIPNTYEVSYNTYVFEVLNMAQLSYNADVSGLDLYVFVTNNSKIVIPYGIININLAGLDELQELDGVGPAYAQKIIDYRAETQFSCIEDLKNISSSIYEKNASRITV